MQLPTAADLVRAFVKDLGAVFDFGGTAVATRCIHFFTLSGATTSWVADRDCVCVGAMVLGSGNSWSFGFDKVNPAAVGTTGIYFSKILASPLLTNLTPVITGLGIPVPLGSTLYLVNGSASSIAVNAFLS
jgi:hypothetical protein